MRTKNCNDFLRFLGFECAYSCRRPGCLLVLCGFFSQTDLLKYRNDLSPGIQSPLQSWACDQRIDFTLGTAWWMGMISLAHLSSIPSSTEACKITTSVTRSLFCSFSLESRQDFTEHHFEVSITWSPCLASSVTMVLDPLWSHHLHCSCKPAEIHLSLSFQYSHHGPSEYWGPALKQNPLMGHLARYPLSSMPSSLVRPLQCGHHILVFQYFCHL